MDEKIRYIKTEEEIKIFSDPYRLKIVNVYQSHDKPLTVKGCADIMGEVPAKVHYHVKKLLKINILELDHVDVINGIHAKYYRLVHDKFSISLEDKTNENIYKQLNQVQNFVIRLLDDFKTDMVENTKKAVDQNINKSSEVGMLSGTYLYLTEEEYNDVQKRLVEIGDLYSKRSEGKKQYNFVGGVTRKKEKNEE